MAVRIITRPALLFDYTDKNIKIYLKKMIRLYSSCTRQINALSFDELHPIQSEISRCVRATYTQVYQDIFQIYLAIYKHTYNYVKNEGILDDAKATMVMNDILNAYNCVTKYVFTSEVERKRSRLFEAVMGDMSSVNGNSDALNGRIGNLSPAIVHSLVKKDVETARNLMVRQIEQYGDQATLTALENAYKDSGIRRVKWVSFEDNRVCGNCEALDGKIFDIDKLPPLPYHYHCRCFIVPA